MDRKVNQDSEMYEELSNDLIVNNSNETNNDEDVSNTSAIYLYLQEIRKYKILTFAEEQELAQKVANGDMLAKEKLITSNLRLVVYVAKNYYTQILDFLDLIQDGNLGLIKAVEMFDYTKGIRFSTYAVPWIKQYISRAIINKWRFIRVPIQIQVSINEYQSIQYNHYISTGKPADITEIADKMHISVDDVKKIQSFIYYNVSLNAPISLDDDKELGDFIKDTEFTLDKNSDKDFLNLLISKSNLTEIEEKIIRLRYDFECDKINSIELIAKKVGHSKEYVTLIESRALRKLRMTAKKQMHINNYS